MNRLPVETRLQILSTLCEGSSLRSISRVTGVSINTVSKLLIDAGNACAAFHDKTVRNVPSKAIQCDEIWSFSYAKQENVKFAKAAPDGASDVWTWTGIDADSKLIVSWHVGDRSTYTGTSFMGDLKARLANRVQLTTDGHKAYLKAVAEVDFVNTSFAERQNLTMRMGMRRFTRLTNAFSKKFENHCHVLALYFVFYNFCRVHKTLGATPAMAAGLVDRVMNMGNIVGTIDAANPALAVRGPYKKREAVENSN